MPLIPPGKWTLLPPVNADGPSDGRRGGEQRGKGGRRGGRGSECWGGERRRLRQTVWLHRDLQHSASYDSRVRGYPHWWISGQCLISLTKEKGVVFTRRAWKVYFRNPSCQRQTVNLSLCRGVTSTNIILFLFFLFFSFISLPERLETPSHSNVCGSVITERRDERLQRTVCMWKNAVHSDYSLACEWKYAVVLCLCFMKWTAHHTRHLMISLQH